MGTWKWKQNSGKILRVVSDYENGTIHVYDEDDNLVMVKKNLSPEAIKLVEKNFLDIVAGNNNRPLPDDNPMYA